MSLKISRESRFRSAYDVLGYLLRLMSLIWHRQLNTKLMSIGLTEMQFVLLIALAWLTETKPDGVQQKELAESCGCSVALASQVLQSLKRKELVRIDIDARDARSRIVTLSRTGEDKVLAALHILERTDEEFRSDAPELFDRLFQTLRELVSVKMADIDQPGRQLGAMPLEPGIGGQSRKRGSQAARA